MEFLDDEELIRITEGDVIKGIHSLPNCAIWDHTEGTIYYVCMEVHSKDNYNKVQFDDCEGAIVRMSELEYMARKRLPDCLKDVELHDMKFSCNKDCLFVTVEFIKYNEI